MSELGVVHFLRVGRKLLNPSTKRGRVAITNALCAEESLLSLAETGAKGLAEIIGALEPRQRAAILTHPDADAVTAIALNGYTKAALELVKSLETSQERARALLSFHAVQSLLRRGPGQQKPTIQMIGALDAPDRRSVLVDVGVRAGFEHAGLESAWTRLCNGLPKAIRATIPAKDAPRRGGLHLVK